MNFWHLLLWPAVLAAFVAGIYGLHRLCLWLEARGWLYYRDRKPESSSGSCFIALQQVLEPPSQHVFQIKEQKRQQTEDDSPTRKDTGLPTRENDT